MKKQVIPCLIAIIMLVLCLSGCAKELKVNDPSLLEFPGVKWGMTMEEVKDALRVKEEQILKKSRSYPLRTMSGRMSGSIM